MPHTPYLSKMSKMLRRFFPVPSVSTAQEITSTYSTQLQFAESENKTLKDAKVTLEYELSKAKREPVRDCPCLFFLKSVISKSISFTLYSQADLLCSSSCFLSFSLSLFLSLSLSVCLSVVFVLLNPQAYIDFHMLASKIEMMERRYSEKEKELQVGVSVCL